MITKDNITRLQEKVFGFTLFTSYLLIFISAVGLSTSSPVYLANLDYYLRIYICLFLILRFNPLKKYFIPSTTNPNNDFTNLDRKIAFSAGMFILTTTIINTYLDTLKTYIGKIL